MVETEEEQKIGTTAFLRDTRLLCIYQVKILYETLDLGRFLINANMLVNTLIYSGICRVTDY